MTRITLTTGKKVIVNNMVDYIKDNGERFTLAIKGDDLYKIVSRDADGIYWEKVKN